MSTRRTPPRPSLIDERATSKQHDESESSSAQNDGKGAHIGASRRHVAKTPRQTENKGQQTKIQQERAPRPTHFLALPLHNFPELRERVASFQNALFEDSDVPAPGVSAAQAGRDNRARKLPRVSSLVQGLDSSIVIDPRRLHMTLGVMSLEPDSQIEPSLPPGEGPSQNLETDAQGEKKTPATALALLSTLTPQIKEILRGDSSVRVPLDVLDVLKTERIRPPRPAQPDPSSSTTPAEEPREQDQPPKLGAGVLFLGPAHVPPSTLSEERRKLMEVCDLVHQAFKKAGYITEKRPLKLHCTILNTSHRKPMRRMPFCYTDILGLDRARKLIGAPETAIGPSELRSPPSSSASKARPTVDEGMSAMTLNDKSPADKAGQAERDKKQKRTYPPPVAVPPPLPVNLGTYDVRSIELWVMGSRNENNEYVSVGGISL